MLFEGLLLSKRNWLLCGLLVFSFLVPEPAMAKKSKKGTSFVGGTQKSKKRGPKPKRTGKKAKKKPTKGKRARKASRNHTRRPRARRGRAIKVRKKKRLRRRLNLERRKHRQRLKRTRRSMRRPKLVPLKKSISIRRSKATPESKKAKRQAARKSAQPYPQKAKITPLNRHTKIRRIMPRKAILRGARVRTQGVQPRDRVQAKVRPTHLTKSVTRSRQTDQSDGMAPHQPSHQPETVRADAKSPETVRRQWEETRRRIVEAARTKRRQRAHRPRGPRASRRRMGRDPATGQILQAHGQSPLPYGPKSDDAILESPVQHTASGTSEYGSTPPHGTNQDQTQSTNSAHHGGGLGDPDTVLALESTADDDHWYRGVHVQAAIVWSFYDLLDDSGPPISQVTTREDYRIDPINFYRLQGLLKTRYLDARFAYQSNRGVDLGDAPSVLLDLAVGFSSVDVLQPLSLRYAVLDFNYGRVNLSDRQSGNILEAAEFKTQMSTYELGYTLGQHFTLLAQRSRYAVPRNVYLDMALFPAERLQISEQLLEVDSTIYAIGARIQIHESESGFHGALGLLVGFGTYDINTLVDSNKLDYGHLSQVELLGRVGYSHQLTARFSLGGSVEIKTRSLVPTGLPNGVQQAVREAGESPGNMNLSFGKFEWLQTVLLEIRASL